MSLASAFRSTATIKSDTRAAGIRKKRRPAPFSIRLSSGERQRLLFEARGTPLGAYIKYKLLNGDAPIKPRRSGQQIADREALAKALALLGRSQLANNLQILASAARIGALPLDARVDEELNAALDAVYEVRHLLMTALGLRSRIRP